MAAPVLVTGTTGNDTLVVTATSADDGSYQLNSDAPVLFTDATTFTFNGLAGDDTFTLNNPSGGLFAPSGPITYDGGGQAGDTLAILGGSALIGANYVPFSSTSGQIAHDNSGGVIQTINFNNVGTGPITDTVTEGFLAFFAITSGADTISISDGGQVGAQDTTVVDGPGFVGVRFANKTILDITTFQFPGTDTLNFDNPTPAAGLTVFVAQNFGPVTQAAPVNYDNLVLHEIAGPVTLTLDNDVDFLSAELTGAGQPFLFRDLDDVFIFNHPNANGVSTSNGQISVTTSNGFLSVDAPVNAGTATASLTAGSSGSADNALSIAVGVTGTGGVVLTGDNMALAAAVNAGPETATLRPFQAGTLINLGGADGANTLGLTDAELDLVTAGAIAIGNGSAGAITVRADINPNNVTGDLSLHSGGDIALNANVTITSALDLELSAGDNVTLSADAILLSGADITILVDEDGDAGAGGTADLRNGFVVPGPAGVIRVFAMATAIRSSAAPRPNSSSAPPATISSTARGAATA
jgi:hypothetical protein